MVFVYIGTVILILFVSYYTEKSILNPTFLLSIFWGVIGFLASLGLYDINRPSDKVWLVTLLGLVSFWSGDIIRRKIIKNKRVIFSKSRGEFKYCFKARIYKILLIIMLLYTLRRISTVVALWRAGYSLDIIRLVYFGFEVAGYQATEFIATFEIFFHLPCLYGCMTLVAINLALPKNKKFLDFFSMIGSIGWIVMAQVVSGGRTIIYIFVVEVIISFIMFNSVNNINKFIRKNIRLIIITCIAIVVVYELSIARKKSDSYDVMYALYSYFTGCFAHMGIRFEQIDFSPYTCGVSLFSGVLRPFMLAIKYICGSVPGVYQRTLDIATDLQSVVYIGKNVEFNAYVLPVFYFYYDGAYIGVVLDSIICGLFSGVIYRNMKNDKSPFFCSMYLLIIYVIFTSMIMYAGNLVYYVFAFLVVRLLFEKKIVR